MNKHKTNHQLEDILKRHKLYITRPRTLLFETLSASSAPMSIDEISAQINGEASRASIYRTLQTLIKLNVIKRITLSFIDKYELSDQFTHHQHYLACESCGRVVPIKLGDKMESSIHSFGIKHGFRITSHEVELRGLCRYCV